MSELEMFNGVDAKGLAELGRIMAACRASVRAEVNPHRDCYESIEEYIKSRGYDVDESSDWSQTPTDIRKRIVEADRLFTVHAYPTSPVGFYSAWGSTLHEATSQILEPIEAEFFRSMKREQG